MSDEVRDEDEFRILGKYFLKTISPPPGGSGWNLKIIRKTASGDEELGEKKVNLLRPSLPEIKTWIKSLTSLRPTKTEWESFCKVMRSHAADYDEPMTTREKRST